MKPSRLFVLLSIWLAAVPALAVNRPQEPVLPYEPEPGFDQWLESALGQKASLAQMRQRCDRVTDAAQNLSCSVSVVARMFEAKAANQLPDYYLSTRRKHAGAITANQELNQLFSMFGEQSLAVLRATGDFTVKRSRQRQMLSIHRYASDAFVAREVLPFIDVEAGNGHSARFVLDTGAPQTRVNYNTAKLMGIKLLTDSRYAYSTFYGERQLSARLGILRSIRVGNTEFRNVLVFVSDRDNLLGLDLISKLGPLKITRKTLELNPAPAVHCESPLVYERIDINQRLLVAARLDNRRTQAIIDTGNVDYLTSAAPGDRINVVKSLSPGNSTLGTADTQRFQAFKGELSLPGRTMAITYRYYPGFTIPPSWVLGRYVPSILLGWGAFEDFELNLDVEAGRSCLNKI
ncbi:retropepsin-like aspartic protease [Pseudomonas sp. NPDC089569]|uniref:retropepsin-like aspartic protease n=1 Tax=Pseudomonas sp. NPDC089569 TaxID=3390722 RepID=UPI003D08414A